MRAALTVDCCGVLTELAADGKIPGMDIPGVTSTPTSGSASGAKKQAKKKATPIDEANQLFNSLVRGPAEYAHASLV